MALLLVKGNELICGAKHFRCAVGKSGFSEHKKEGDGCTPLGIFPLRECWYRVDRVAMPQTDLPLHIIKENDGWCDDPGSPAYNHRITLPYHFSYEQLWREDRVYDVIVPIGYNDEPVVPGRGSAIFMHVAHEDYRPTEGCVALAMEDLLEVLKLCDPGTNIEIREE